MKTALREFWSRDFWPWNGLIIVGVGGEIILQIAIRL